MKKCSEFNLLKLIECLLIPSVIGFLSYLFTKNNINIYDIIKKPFLSPPPIVFIIIWSILYLLMGISYYLILSCKRACTENIDYNLRRKKNGTVIFYIQLLFNFLWSLIFFNLRLYFISFIDLIVLLSLVIIMIFKFYKINKAAAFLQIPYVLWITFAGYLNLSIYLLNEAFS